MFTTATFQKRPDFYQSKSACEASMKGPGVQTNPRYKRFRQTHFTAGDEEQFEAYRDAVNGEPIPKEPTMDNNVFADLEVDVWDKNTDVGGDAVGNTFRYMFHKFKKGIFVKIAANRVKVFLPFSKAHYSNEWGDRIGVDQGKYASMKDFMSALTTMEGYRFDPRSVNDDPRQWYGNNCLVRYEYPIAENDTNTGCIKDMLDDLCQTRSMPDIEFFINKRDFPVMTRDGTEPYHNIWDSEDHPLVSHCYPKYSPILSMSNTARYADLLIPTCDDWARVQSAEGKWFAKLCRDYSDRFDTPWEDKIPTAVFRGSSTGCGVTTETNPRLRLAAMNLNQPESSDGVPLLDAGLTKWNLRPRKIKGDKYLRSIDPSALPFGLVQPLSPSQQSSYKYVINVDGHVTAFRLSLELSMGSVVLLVSSPWRIWYSHMLVPYEHYVPVNGDLSDLFTQIEWCREHDSMCKRISENARKFYDSHLGKQGVLDYMQMMIATLKRKMGIYLYNVLTPLDAIIGREYTSLDFSYPKVDHGPGVISFVPTIERSYGLLSGVEWVVRKIIREKGFEDVAMEHGEIFRNRLGSVRRFALAGFSCIVKTTSNPVKSKEHIHEAFVGTKCTNEVLKHVPNFSYVFGLYRKGDTFNVVAEYVEGMSLFEYIESDEFSFGEYLFILVQIFLAIQVAQDAIAFVHYDLTPWNIMLKRLDEPKSFDYVLGLNKVIRIRTSVIPIIIDYGKSHVVQDGIHHGLIEMFRGCQVQDVVTLIVVTINQIAHRKRLEKKDLGGLFHMANSISGTSYCPTPFHNTKCIRSFFGNASKYAELIRDNKGELQEKEPYDFVLYIMRLRKDYHFPVGLVNSSESQMNRGNSRQVFDFVFSDTTEKRICTYSSAIERVSKCTLPSQPNPLFERYGLQQMLTNLVSLWEEMKSFLRTHGYEEARYEKLFSEALEHLRRQVKPVTYGGLSVSCRNTTLVSTPYTVDIFLRPDYVLQMVEEMSKTEVADYTDCREIILSCLLNFSEFSLKHVESRLCTDEIEDILSQRSFYARNNAANRKTLVTLMKEIYKANLEALTGILDGEQSVPPDLRDTIGLYERLSCFN